MNFIVSDYNYFNSLSASLRLEYFYTLLLKKINYLFYIYLKWFRDKNTLFKYLKNSIRLNF